MSRGFNRVILMGNLTRDPDVRYTPSKQKVARITVAVGRQWKNKATGELQSHTDFINVVAWSFLADLCERYLRKGRPVLLEGRLSVREYDDSKTGQRKWFTEVVADNIVLLSSGRRDDSYSYDSQNEDSGQQQRQEPASRQRAHSSDAVSSGDMASLRGEAGFEDEFPLDFSELGDDDGPGDVDIPF
jgi:single-strand DNA-binding protein